MNTEELVKYIRDKGYTKTWVSLKLGKNKAWVGDKIRYYKGKKISDKTLVKIKSIVKEQMEIEVENINEKKQLYRFEKTKRIFSKSDEDKEIKFMQLLSKKYNLKEHRISFIEKV